MEQLNRVKRWFERLKKCQTGSAEQEDVLLAFCVNCYHLRDFLISSKVASKNNLDEFIGNNVQMQICRDICNESKHCMLDSPSIFERDKKGKKITAGWFAGVLLLREQDILTNKPKLIILANGKKHDALELARKCIALWKEFFKKSRIQY
ncbi:hypothetical protein HY993_04385 [Candidatus Micrarchaeota archaeon]|nr:hypothetical protein [Candidatus Micrarchaeota archaeon]